jgi:hypothetical protein
MIITVSEPYVAVVRYNGVELSFEHTVNRSDFVSDFSGVDLSNVRTLSYEPDRSLYHILNSDYTLSVLPHPQDDPRMAFIHLNANVISDYFDAKFAQKEEEAQAYAAQAQAALAEQQSA